MLEYLRNAAEKPVAKVLIGLLAFSFVGWGVAEWIFGGATRDTTLVTVGDADISLEQYNAEKSRELMQMTREQQRAVYTDAAAGRDFANRIITQISTQQMVQNRAADLGFIVTDARIAREIRDYSEFQENGQFSARLFDSVLSNSGWTEDTFAAYLRSQTLRAMVLGAMSFPLPTSEFITTATYNARNATRKIEYATVKFSDFNVAKPTDEQLREFYATRPQIIPEHRSVSYVLIPAEMSKPDAYDAAFKIAQSVEDEIIGGAEFATAAKKHGAKYVNIGDFARDKKLSDAVMDDAMIARVFDMDAGLESELIETKNGFVIVRVDKITPSRTAEFDAVKKGLISDWRTAEQKKQAYVRANEILVGLNKDGKMAKSTSATVSRASGAPVAVLNAAFNSPAGTNMITEQPDAFYVLHIDSEIAPKADAKKMDALRREMGTMSSLMIMDDYNSFLKRTYPVEINEKMYNQFIAK